VKTYTVMMQLSGKRGGLSVPMVQLASKDAAEDAVRSRQNEFMQLMEHPIIRPTGPDEGELVMNVRQLLHLIGVENVGHFIDETEVQEGERIVTPKILLSH